MNEGSIICVLYGDQTVDDIIYEKLDWDQVTGEDVNVYFIWNPPNPPLTADGPPRNAVPSENDIDPESLEVKGTYPGRYDGDEYTADSNGNVLDIEDRIARNPQDIPKLIFDAKGSYGRFRVTNHNGWILAQIPDGEQWETLFLGTLNYPFDFTEDKPFTEEDTSSVKSLQPGEPYPGGKGADAVELLYRQKHGGVIGRKAAKGAIIHALNAENARNQNAGAAYEKLLSAIKELDFSSGTISKFFLLPSGDAIFYKDGQARFITHLDSKLDFPDG